MEKEKGDEGVIAFTPEELTELGIEGGKDDLKKYIETLKSAEPKVVEKEYEFSDDYIKSAVDYYNQHGTIEPFIQANVDYSKKTPEELIAMDIRANNEGLSEKAVAILTKKEFEKYNVPEDASEEDKTLQEELFNVRINKIRKGLSEDAKKFIAPEKPSAKMEQWVSSIENNEVTKALKENKTLSFKHGDDEFTYEVADPDGLTETVMDQSKFRDLFKGKDGNIDLEKFYKVVAYASNPELFEEVLIKHGKSQGTESVLKDMKNPQRVGGTVSKAEAETLLKAFAERRGK